MIVKAIPLPAHLLEKMAKTEQNPRYHAEGSVLAHTELVIQKFHELKGNFALSASDERILYWAAALHDLGKTEVTRFEDGRWRSPGHEIAGFSMARNVLLKDGSLTPLEQSKVLGLGRWHGIPLKWSKYSGKMDELKQLGTQTDLRLLGIFGVFDFQGRDCEDKPATLEMIERFQKIAVPKAEYEIGRYDDLQSTFANWNLRHKNAAWNALKMGNVNLVERLVDATGQSDIQSFGKKVYLTVGPALSGKSHYIAEHLPDAHHVQLEDHEINDDLLRSDYLFARKMVEFKHFLVIYLNRYRHVVLEGRNLNIELRKKLNEVIRGLEVELEYLVFESTLDELHERNDSLDAPLPKEAIETSYRNQTLLHPWEAHKMHLLRG